MDIPGEHTYQEIRGQADAWEATLAAVEAQAESIGPWLQGRRNVVFTGCGSTYYLSVAAAATWQRLTKAPARALPGSELWLFPDLWMPEPPDLLVAVSRSGETSETLRAIEAYRAAGGRDVLAVTCYTDRPLNAAATRTLLAHGAEEASLAETRSFTSMLWLCYAAASLAAGRGGDIAAFRAAAREGGNAFVENEDVAMRLGVDMRIKDFVFLGSGPMYGLACEAMLKMKEMSLSESHVFHFMEFRHGPKSVVTPETLIVGLLSDTAQAQEAKVLAEMRHLGGKVWAIGDTTAGVEADYTVTLGSGLGEDVRGALMLPVLQLLAYHRAMAKGENPDRPKNLSMVVKL